MRRPLSIALRLNGLFLAILAIVLVAGGAWLTAAIEGHFKEQDRMEIAGKLAPLRRVVAGLRTAEDLQALPGRLDELLAGRHGASIAVADGDGALLLAAPGFVFPEGWAAAAVPPPAAIGAPFLRWDRDGASYRGLVEVMPTGFAAVRELRVGVALDIEHHQQFMQALGEALLPALAACLALAGLLTWVATRQGLAPLREMAGVARGISASRLDQRLAVDTVPKELVDLATSFNGMLGRLEDSFRRLQDFSADIAHELRTPVSNLLMQTQVALQRPRARRLPGGPLLGARGVRPAVADDLRHAVPGQGRQRAAGPEPRAARPRAGGRRVKRVHEPLATERGVALRRQGKGR
jgi:two-component system heavy metal sensor histidine kinase CusS